MAKVRKTDTCWLFTGALSQAGYGMISNRAIDDLPRLAHRLSYTLFIGPVPKGVFVLHRCDVPACVRPDHLFLGDQTDNMSDCSKKHRHHYLRRISPADRARILVLRDAGATLVALAKMFGIGHTGIHHILKTERARREASTQDVPFSTL